MLGPWQASIAVKFYQIEPPELQRSNQKIPLEFRKHQCCIIAIRRIGVKTHAGRRDGRDPHPGRIDIARQTVMLADAQAGGIFAAMADRRPAEICPAVMGRADDVDFVATARPMFMCPDIAGARMYRHALRVAVADGEDLGCPSRLFGIGIRDGTVTIDPDQAAGMGGRVLRIVACAAVAKAGIDHPAGDLQSAAEMMPGAGWIIAGKNGLPADKGVAGKGRAIYGGG